MPARGLAERRDIAAHIAVAAAGRAATMRANGMGEATLKGAQDFLTEADGATEAFIRAELAKAFPGEPVLGEELGGTAENSGWLWVIDPIDGTSNFARGGHRWCVSIGLVRDGRAVAGVIARHRPAEVFVGAEGCGARLNGAPIAPAAGRDISRAIVEIGWSLRRPLAAYTGLVAAAMRQGIGTRSGGSGALGVVEAACGRLDGYLELHINAWDVAAALAIARAAGCWTSPHDCGPWLVHGNPIGVGVPAFAATLGALLAEYAQPQGRTA